MTAKALGFDGPTRNSLDSVSDRDSLLEFMSAAAICAMHLSRLAEEIIIWMSAPFGFVRLPDRWTTGSSMMPQKRNPDAAELVRGKTGRVIGSLVALLTVMKGLPLTYSKDMQEDKEQLFDAADAIEIVLAAMTGMIEDLEPVPERMAAVAGAGFSTATDLADWLVRSLDIPFRDAHHITGRIVVRGREARLQPRGSAARCDAGDRAAYSPEASTTFSGSKIPSARGRASAGHRRCGSPSRSPGGGSASRPARRR